MSWSDYILDHREFEFIDSTSNRLERRNRIIKQKISKFPGNRAIDKVCCLKSYFILKNIDVLSKINNPSDKGIIHKQQSLLKFNKILFIIDGLRLRKNKRNDKAGVIEIIEKILTFFD